MPATALGAHAALVPRWCRTGQAVPGAPGSKAAGATCCRKPAPMQQLHACLCAATAAACVFCGFCQSSAAAPLCRLTCTLGSTLPFLGLTSMMYAPPSAPLAYLKPKGLGRSSCRGGMMGT
jgi:hypothetical protein